LGALFFNIFGIIFGPTMPVNSLDGSWIYSMNQAVAQRMVFGRDIIFSFGPYASVYTHAYHPATVWIMLVGCLLIDSCYACCFVWLVRRAHWPWLLILAALLIAPLITPDGFFYSLPLLEALFVFRLLDEEMARPRRPVDALLAAVVFGCAGMIPLIKLSFAVMELGVFVLCLSFLVLRRQWTMMLICSLAPLLGMLLFWVAAGQKLANLPVFFSASLPIITGYTEAMSEPVRRREVLLFLIGALAILLAIVFARRLKQKQRFFLLLAYAFYLLISFKAGFVRHGLQVFTSWDALAVGSLSLTLLQTPQRKRFNSVSCLIAFVVALLPMGFLLRENFFGDLQAEFEEAGTHKGPLDRALLDAMRTDLRDVPFLSLLAATEPQMRALHPWEYNPKGWRDEFNAARREINASSQLNFVMPGRVDVYSYEQSALLSRDYAWDPRPVVQSYSAYTPWLIRTNEQHLRSSGAPEHIVFRLETIDDRLPALDDGLSWPAMLDNYRVAEVANGWVHLTRKPGPLRTESHFIPLEMTSAELGQEVTLPSGDGPIFVQIDLSSSFYGRLLEFPYKMPMLKLTLSCGNNRRLVYRTFANMMKTGFFLSPLITDNEDFVRLFSASGPLREDDKVRSMRLSSDGPGWLDRYTITFRRYEY
jgi:hypothetical protein